MDTSSTPKSEVLAGETHVPGIDPNDMEEPHARGSAGSVIGILLIVFLLVVGAFYVWGQRLSEERATRVTPAIAQ